MSRPPAEKTGVNPPRETKVLAVSLPETGPYAFHRALQTLGYDNVYHAATALQQPAHCRRFAEAADRLFPSLPAYNGEGMARADWDQRLLGPCDAITDVAGPFAESLIDAYPDARVILVTPDFDVWARAMHALLDHVFGRVAALVGDYVEPMVGPSLTRSAQNILLGWTGQPTADAIRANLRPLYDRHHALVRAKVPRGRLLEYRVGEGWEPLCGFLGRPVPREPFPSGHDEASLGALLRERRLRAIKDAAALSWMYLVAAVMMVWAAYVGWRH